MKQNPTVFRDRVKKTAAHLKKWAQRENIEAYRVYDRDIPDFPFSVDIYGKSGVLYLYLTDHPDSSQEEFDFAVIQALLEDAIGFSFEHFFVKSRVRKEGKQQYEKLSSESVKFLIQEQGLKFWVNLSDYLDTGLFLDHRKSRALIKSMSQDKSVLNLFCYTASASVCAAAGGANKIVSVDLSNTYLEWAKSNFLCNQLVGNFSFIRSDCTTFLRETFEKFDIIFVDPPTFSNSKATDGDFDIQKNHKQLIIDCARHLKPDGTIFFSNNLRNFKIDEELKEKFEVKNISHRTLPNDFRSDRVHNSWFIKHKIF